ncbi:MAG: hypothetical protein HUK06_09795 [Bacteroidaceae bacterium]|nr:hypothetical protein [Bacteroidaceae bacterium]
MAKKNPEDYTVEEKLKNLYSLQATLTSIDEKRALRGELPLEVQDIEDELEGLKIRQEKIATEIQDYKKAIAIREAEIEEARALTDRYKTQLNDVKNNREYDTLTKEIEFQDLQIQLCDKKIKEAEKKIVERTEDLQKTRKNIEDKDAILEEKKNELEEIIDETRAEEDKLKIKAKDLEAKIESRLLSSFLRIRKNARNGLGVVYVQRDACGGCYSKIPPQRQLDIKMHKKVIVCEYCGRILVDPELAGVKIKAPEEKKPTRKTRATRKRKTEEEE